MVSVGDSRILFDRRKRGIALVLGAAALVAFVIAWMITWTPRQQFAHLGDFRLQSGETIADLVVGYRTAGRLNASRSNAVLFAPWFQGTSGQLAWQVGPGKRVDTSSSFVIMVDALGNGVSSSPSTSARQPGASFPRFTIGDIVESQRLVVNETLHLARLRAVIGISMGGMQVFEWTVAHPNMMDKAVSIVGSPKSQPDDLERWNEGVQRAQVPAWTRAWAEMSAGRPLGALSELRLQPWDYIRQAEAMMAHDVSKRFGGSMERAAATMRSQLLMVSTWEDRTVNPKPAFELARLAGASVLELDGRCGHQAPSCERATLWPEVNRFLSVGVPMSSSPGHTNEAAAARLPLLRGGMMRNIIHLTLGQAATTILAILLSAAIARTLGADEFGLLYLVTTIGTFAYVFVDWRHLPYAACKTARHSERAGELTGTIIVVRALMALGVCVPIGIATWLLGYDWRTTIPT